MLQHLFELDFAIDQIVLFLSSSSPLSILNLGTSNWYFRNLLTTSPHLHEFWMTLIHRTCHTSLPYVAIVECYPEYNVTNHSWLMGARHEVRDEYGECLIEHHQRRRYKSCLFTTRLAYFEWRRIASNRFIPTYWNHRKERKLRALKQQLQTLENEKKYSEIVNDRFDILSSRLKASPSE